MSEEQDKSPETPKKDSFESPSRSKYEEEAIKKFKDKRPKVSITEEERRRLEDAARAVPEVKLTNDEATVLDMLTRRKFLDQIVREFNLAIKPLGRALYAKDHILRILKSLEEKELVKKIIVNEKEIWVSVEYYSEKAFGTDRL